MRLQQGSDEEDQGCESVAPGLLWELTDPFPAAMWTGSDDQLNNGHILNTTGLCWPAPLPQSAVIETLCSQQEELVCSVSDAKHCCHL